MAPKARMNLVLDADLEEKFRNAVFKSKGMKKGNISEAVEEAIETREAPGTHVIQKNLALLAAPGSSG